MFSGAAEVYRLLGRTALADRTPEDTEPLPSLETMIAVLAEALERLFSERAEEQAGLLAYHAGVSVNMNYAAGGSGAWHGYVPGAFEDHFRFEAEKIDSNAVFYDILYENMENRFP